MAKTTKQQIRVLMADDHAIFREGLRKLLDGDDEITIVGEASNGTDCIKMLGKLKPDILLLDLRMPDKDGLAVLEEVNFDQLPTRVVVLTAAEADRTGFPPQAPGARNPLPATAKKKTCNSSRRATATRKSAKSSSSANRP